ncbi:MAG: hypothetical protein EPO20_30505 [Betaproteobacteria bacterium]|nr:MAG: hypothetical protein EPO20_30505 [Betaproteobacteria bacterium]
MNTLHEKKISEPWSSLQETVGADIKQLYQTKSTQETQIRLLIRIVSHAIPEVKRKGHTVEDIKEKFDEVKLSHKNNTSKLDREIFSDTTFTELQEIWAELYDILRAEKIITDTELELVIPLTANEDMIGFRKPKLEEVLKLEEEEKEKEAKKQGKK